jgi:hypothetical protein
MMRQLLTLALVLLALPASAQPPVVTPTQHLYWDHDGIQTTHFRLCADNVVPEKPTEVVCHDVPGGRTVRSAPIPALTPGPHTLTVEACRLGTSLVCSASDPFAVVMEVKPAKPTGLRIGDAPPNTPPDEDENDMAISVVQTSSVILNTADTNTPTNVSLPSVAAGNWIVVGAGAYSPGGLGASAASDDKSDVFTRAGERNTPNNNTAASYYASNVAGGTTQVTVSPNTGHFQSFVALEIDAPTDATVETPTLDNQTSATMSAPSITPSTNDSIAVVVFAWDGASDVGTPSGWTLEGKHTPENAQCIAVFSKIQTDTTAYAPTSAIAGGSRPWAAVMFVISAPDGGGGGGENPWYAYAQQ